jgi:folylpolyglutamate synthase/dihydropteroate synthase
MGITMKNTQSIKQTVPHGSIVPPKQRSYHELVEYLDTHWQPESSEQTLQLMKALDQAFGNICQKMPTILVTGINGKSLTTHFTSKLLREEGLVVGAFYSPHMLTYNERFTLNNDIITNKSFVDIANEVIMMVETLGLPPSTNEILAIIAFLYFKQQHADVALFEVGSITPFHPLVVTNPKIACVTRVSEKENNITSSVEPELLTAILSIVKPGTYTVSADQSKLSLQNMQTMVEEMDGIWVMPIRKLAPLSYPFEQLHGRCAALAERIAQIYIEHCSDKESVIVANSLLSKQSGRRGRPTLEAKRQSELNPKRTVEQFWKETVNTLPGRFQLLDKEKPMILLDNASNIDALSNLLLGIRLLHYQRSLKGLTIIADCKHITNDMAEFLRLLRYFFKKTSGQIVICPSEPLPGEPMAAQPDIEAIVNDIKNMKIKAHSAKNFQEAFEFAASCVDERNGLVVITGSSALINKYWQHKGIKKVALAA